MVSESVVDKMIQSLAFEVEAVPLNATSEDNSHTVPIKLRIKVKKKENYGMQRAILSTPKFRSPEMPKQRIGLVTSDQTIMSFDVSMEADFAKKPKKKSRRSFFGVCLGTQYDDDYSPYLPSNFYNEKMADENVPSKSDSLLKQNFTLSKGKYARTKFQSRTKKPDVFGKCKPGGCLDPPFSEEKYAYKPYQKQKLKENSIKEGTLATTTIVQDVDLPYSLRINSEDSFAIPKTEPIIEDDSIINLYVAKTNASPDSKRSDSIITYPPETPSPVITYDKPLKNKVIKEETQRKSYNGRIDVLYSFPRKKSLISENSGNYFPKKIKKNNNEVSNSVSIKEGNENSTTNRQPLTSPSVQEGATKNTDNIERPTDINLKRDIKEIIAQDSFKASLQISSNDVTKNESGIFPKNGLLRSIGSDQERLKENKMQNDFDAKYNISQYRDIAKDPAEQSALGLTTTKILKPAKKSHSGDILKDWHNYKIINNDKINLTEYDIERNNQIKTATTSFQEASNENKMTRDIYPKEYSSKYDDINSVELSETKISLCNVIKPALQIKLSTDIENSHEIQMTEITDTATMEDTNKYINGGEDNVELNTSDASKVISFNFIKPVLQTQVLVEDNIFEFNQVLTAVSSIQELSKEDKLMSEIHTTDNSNKSIDRVENYDFNNKIVYSLNDTEPNELPGFQTGTDTTRSRNANTTLIDLGRKSYLNNFQPKLSNPLSHTKISNINSTGIIKQDQYAGMKYETNMANENIAPSKNNISPTIIEENEIRSKVASVPRNNYRLGQFNENSMILDSDNIIEPDKNYIHETSKMLSENNISTNFNDLENVTNQPARSSLLKYKEQIKKSRSDSFLKVKRSSRENIMKEYSLQNFTHQPQQLNPLMSIEQIIETTKDIYAVLNNDSYPINESYKDAHKTNKTMSEDNLFKANLSEEATTISSPIQKPTNIRKKSMLSLNTFSNNRSRLLDESKHIEALYLQNKDIKQFEVKSSECSKYQNSWEGLDSKGKGSKIYNDSALHDNLDVVNEFTFDETNYNIDNLDPVQGKYNITPSYMTSASEPNNDLWNNFNANKNSQSVNIEDSRLFDSTVTKYSNNEGFNITHDKFDTIIAKATDSTQFEATLMKLSKLQQTLDLQNNYIASSGSTWNDIVYLDLAFLSQVNERNERTIKTINTSNVQNISDNDVVRVIQAQVRPTINEINVPVDLENDLAVQIKITKTQPTCKLQKKNDVLKEETKRDLCDKITGSEIQTVLNTIYEQELIPLENTIKNLKKDIDLILAKQSLLIRELCKAIKAKPIRLLRVKTRCGCWRK